MTNKINLTGDVFLKLLNVKNPILSTFPEYGSVFSIIPQNELSENWMYSNFVQYYVKRNNLFLSGEELLIYRNHVNFLSHVPTLQHYKVCEDILIKLTDKSLLDTLIHFIDEEFYIILLLDRSFISQSINYKKSPLVHLTLIYGYDEKKRVFYIADNNNYGKYDFMQYNFDDVINAFRAMNYNDFRDTKTINLVRPFNHIYYSFDLKYLIKEFNFYLESYDFKNTYLKNWNPYNPLNYGHDKEFIEYYNLGVYEYLKELLGCEDKYIGIQPFHFIWENKKFMLRRIEFLKNRGYILASISDLIWQCKNLINETQTILNLVVKYNLTNNKALLPNIINKIDVAKEGEVKLIENLMKALN